MAESKSEKKETLPSPAKSGVLKFIWDFKTFNKDLYAFGEDVRSPEFSLKSSSSERHRFDFYPQGKTMDSAYSSLYLIQTKGEEDTINVSFSCSLSASKNTKKRPEKDVNQASSTIKIPKKNAAWVYPCKRFPNGDFALEMVVFYDEATGGEMGNYENVEELSNHLLKAYEKKLFYDKTISHCEIVYKTHRALFDTRFQKLSSQPVSTDSLEKLIRYVYGGKLDRTNIPTELCDVLSAHEPNEMQPPQFANPSQIKAETCFDARNASVPWKIQNFSHLIPGETVSCYIFADEHSKWTWLRVVFRVVDPSTIDSSQANIAISLHRCSERCKFVVCHADIAGTGKLFRHRFESEDSWDVPPFVARAALLQLPNDELNIHFEVCVFDGSCSTTVKKTYIKPQVSPFSDDLNQLRQDMRILRGSEDSDFKLEVGSEVFHVHKFVLCTRSQVLRNLIEQNENTRSLAIECDASIMKSMLKFIYSAEVDISGFEQALSLFFAAHTFEIPGLQKACSNYLKGGLTGENVMRVLLLADDCSDRGLVGQAMEFICSNSLSALISREWNTLKERQELLKGLLEASLKHSGENKVPNDHSKDEK